jgi:hypothetical protein
MLWLAYANWRYDWGYRYGKWFQANLFGKPFDRVTESGLARIFFRGFPSSVLLLVGGAFLILGIGLMFGL